MYGPGYANSIPVLVLLGLCVPPMYLNIMLSQVLVAARRQIAWTGRHGRGDGAQPGAEPVLIGVAQRRYDNGAIGAAVSLLLTELVIAAVGTALVGGVVDRRMARRVGRTAAASAVTWLVAVAARGLGTAASLALAAATFALLGAALRVVAPEEAAAIRAAAARVAARRPALRRRRAASVTAAD